MKKINKKYYSIRIINADTWREIAHYVNTYYDSQTITIKRYDGGVDVVDNTNSAYILICKYRDEIESIKIDAETGESHLCIHYCGNADKSWYSLKITGEIQEKMKFAFDDFKRAELTSAVSDDETKRRKDFLLRFGISMFMISIYQSLPKKGILIAFIVFMVLLTLCTFYSIILKPIIDERRKGIKRLQLWIGDDYREIYNLKDDDEIQEEYIKSTIISRAVGVVLLVVSFIIIAIT